MCSCVVSLLLTRYDGKTLLLLLFFSQVNGIVPRNVMLLSYQEGIKVYNSYKIEKCSNGRTGTNVGQTISIFWVNVVVRCYCKVCFAVAVVVPFATHKHRFIGVLENQVISLMNILRVLYVPVTMTFVWPNVFIRNVKCHECLKWD